MINITKILSENVYKEIYLKSELILNSQRNENTTIIIQDNYKLIEKMIKNM